jgi:hypothetical protein
VNLGSFAIMNATRAKCRRSHPVFIITPKSAFRRGPRTATKVLTRFLNARLIDQTGLTGSYDFTLEFTDPNGPPEPGEKERALGVAAESLRPRSGQLGLRLNKAKGLVDVLTIDSRGIGLRLTTDHFNKTRVRLKASNDHARHH